MSLQQFHWAMVPYGMPVSKRFVFYSVALFLNCKLLNPEEDDYLSGITTKSMKSVSFCSFLPNAMELEREISG